MSINKHETTASCGDIWSVLSEPQLYSQWVAGTRSVDEAESSWPTPGSQLRHTSGFGPVEVHDVTIVRESEPERRIYLEARLGKIGTAMVDITFEKQGNVTAMTIEEDFVEGLPSHFDPLTDAALKGRNVETLRRLANLAESRPGTHR